MVAAEAVHRRPEIASEIAMKDFFMLNKFAFCNTEEVLRIFNPELCFHMNENH